MIIKEVTQVGNKVIRAKGQKVINLKSKEIRNVIRNLIDSMRYHELVGMAAPQIGKSHRIFVTEIRATKYRKKQSLKSVDTLKIYVNPRILWRSKKLALGYEGRGSIASSNLFAPVQRPQSVIIRAYDKNGKMFEIQANGLLARVIQHEYDHIDGIVFTDKADPRSYMSRNEYLNKS